MLNSCITTHSIKGSYNIVKETTTKTPYDEVWSKVIDFFAENSVPIGTISKESGLITANNVYFGNDVVCIENYKGIPESPTAWFVLPYNQRAIDGRVSCSFNVRIKPTEKGETYIGVNIGYVVGYYDIMNLNNIIKSIEPQDAVSTGLFEISLLRRFK